MQRGYGSQYGSVDSAVMGVDINAGGGGQGDGMRKTWGFDVVAGGVRDSQDAL